MHDTAASLPWDLTTIQRLVLNSCKEGARLAAKDSDVRSRAEAASELEEAFIGTTRVAASQATQRLVDRMATDFHDRWENGLAAVLVPAVEAAIVIGARAIAREEESSCTADDLQDLADDELWMAPEADRLLVRVVDAVVAAGHPLPGAQAFLDAARPAPAPRVLEIGAGADYEVRTEWIPDADTGRAYQWGVRREGDGLLIWKRRRGSRVVEKRMVVPLRHRSTLLRLLAGPGNSA